MHLALLCPPFYSHLRVFEALGSELAARGHRVTLVLNAGAAEPLGATRRLTTVEAEHAGRGTPPAVLAMRGAARPTGILGTLRTVADTARLTDELCREGPGLLAALGAEAIVGDETEGAAGLLAARLGLPLVSIACGLPVDPDPAVPLPYLAWDYDPSEKGLKRNAGGRTVARLLLTRQRRVLALWARRFGLEPREGAEDWTSTRLRLSQTVPAFDFPHSAPSPIRGVGPIRARESAGADRALADLPAGRPIVFASLGTMQGHRLGIFRTVAAACRRLGAVSVVAHCGRLSPAEAASIGADLVRDFFPQGPILARADACVSHGGLNTALDAMQAGTPVLAVPIAFDQPGVAARLVHHGAGLRLGRVLLSARAVETSLARLLQEPSFRANASRIGREIERSGGRSLAADLIEEALGIGSSAVRSGAAAR
ncbi:nucleotide disphospho-sugar-binding domain-containing protein [Antarcticirhabdus aurantiaca]|uniref:Glycosyltransferase n=1 Tax=Antarcticirhabdus aurantiaca TaxID=2606717 RepID=A0ACD4NRE9_9HYPH|nr:glycosyltransferase [Antarcticirhabdus aurantiaca]WAJ29267.1 glycosyltransferase [Jeongeuplla avenae]